MIKWLKRAVNFSVSPPLQWPLPQVTNNCGVAVVLTGMTTEITPFPLWATLYLATHQIHLCWCLISTPRPLSIRVSGSRGPGSIYLHLVFMLVSHHSVFCFSVLSFFIHVIRICMVSWKSDTCGLEHLSLGVLKILTDGTRWTYSALT